MKQLRPKSVDNGRRFQVACPPLFIGVAGGRGDARGGEFACVGRPPQRVVAAGTVDDRPVRLLSIRKSTDVAEMVVVRFEYEDEAA